MAAEQKGVEEMRKATKFHSHKKKNYDAKITELVAAHTCCARQRSAKR